MTKSLSNRLYLKSKLYTFKMQSSRTLEDHMDDFNKIILDLENIEIKVEEEDQALLLLISLSREYENLSDTLIFGRESLTLDEVQSALFSKDLKKRTESKEHDSGEGLMVRGWPERRDFSKQRFKSRSKSRTKRRCFICHNEGHFKKDCPKRKRRFSESEKTHDPRDADIVEEGYESAEVLTISETDSSKDWILDSGCTFHLTPNKDWFEELNQEDGG